MVNFINGLLGSLLISGLICLPVLAKQDCQALVESNNNPNLIMAYGQGRSVDEAKRMALREIVESLQANISSRLQMTTEIDGNKVRIHGKSEIKISANMTLENASRNCFIQIAKDNFMLAYQVDQRSSIEKLTQKITSSHDTIKPKRYVFNGLKPLLSGQFVKILLEKVNQNPGDGQEQRYNVRLYRNLNGWYLAVGNINQRLNSADLPTLLKWNKSGDITLHIISRDRQARVYSLHQGEDFTFNVTSSQPGFVTLFNLYDDGRVSQLLPSHKIEQRLTLPKNADFGAVLLEGNKAALDTYIAIVTAHEISSQFSMLDQDGGINRGEATYVLDKFMNWLSQQEVIAINSINVHTTTQEDNDTMQYMRQR